MKSKRWFLGWILRSVAIVVCVGAVALCIVSAVLSILKLINTYNTPASSYVRKANVGYHTSPGIIFAGRDLALHQCENFNFTSLDIDALNKVSRCDPKTFSVHSSNPASDDLLEEMPVTLRELEGELTFMLLKGPKDWSNKETDRFHVSIPADLSGVWAIIHPEYEIILEQFLVAGHEASFVNQRWLVAKEILSDYSANFVTPNYQQFYLMSKRVFKSFGKVQAIRVDMEVAILEQNETHLDEMLPASRDTVHYEHLELYYQWKDANYMEGDRFIAANIWTIVTILISAMLMFERAFNTLMKAWNMSKTPSKAPKEDQKAAEADDNAKQNGGDKDKNLWVTADGEKGGDYQGRIGTGKRGSTLLSKSPEHEVLLEVEEETPEEYDETHLQNPAFEDDAA